MGKNSDPGLAGDSCLSYSPPPIKFYIWVLMLDPTNFMGQGGMFGLQ